jgi:hypothetical protein
MKYTNKMNLPEPIVRGILDHKYGGAGEDKFASVTDLLKPPHQLNLMKKHWDDLEEDVSDKIWQSVGNGFHLLFEKYNENASETLTEERLSIEIDGKKITGGIDIYYKDLDQKYVVADFKTTSTWKYRNNDFNDFDLQVNCYAYMLEKMGYTVDKLQAWVLFRDWMASGVEKTAGYPESQLYIRGINRINDKELDQWIRGKIFDIENAYIGKITDCKPEERWETPTVYAVMKNDNKRSVKNHETSEEAFNHVNKLYATDPKNNYSIQHRPGIRKRCEGYCSVNQYCESYKAYVASKEGER